MASGLRRFAALGMAAACLCGAVGSARAAAFTLRPGEVKLFVSGLVTQGDRYFDATGKPQKRGLFRKSDAQVFAEFGLIDGVTAFGASSLEKIVTKDGFRSSRDGFGRSEFGLRARLLQKGEWIVSTQVSAIIAGAKKSDGRAAVGEADDQVDVRALVARSFEVFGKPAFLDIQGGYRTRSGDPADEVRFDTTLGIRVMPPLLVLVQNFNTIGLKRWNGPYPLLQRITKVQLGALYDVTDRLSVFGAVFTTPIGVDALEERGVTFGVGYRF